MYMESRMTVLMNLSAGQQGRHRLKNRLVDTVGEGEGGTNWENSMETYITIWKRDSMWEFAVWHRELKPVLCDNLRVGWGRMGRKVTGGRGHMYTCDSCMAETNTIL